MNETNYKKHSEQIPIPTPCVPTSSQAGVGLGSRTQTGTDYYITTFTFTFSHLADAFIQSDLHTHVTFTLMAHTAHQEQLGVQ